MSMHFHALQFNPPYKPSKLNNWEIPQRYKRRPNARIGKTQIIANDNGHILPGVPKPQYVGSGAWGHFIDTWKMPKKITRDLAPHIHNPRPKSPVRPELAITSKARAYKPKEKPKDTKPEVEELPPAGKDPCENLPEKTEKPPKSFEEKDLSYVPGDLTDPKYRHESYDLLRPKPVLTLEDLQAATEMCEKQEKSAEKYRQKPKSNPFACVYRNFEMAKQCAKENLEHHPLPDTVTNAMFRKLQLERAQNPGLALDEEAGASGIGWKGYGATGPTQCTKLKVYRPKTCTHKKLKNLDEKYRPGSCGTFDMKWRFIKQKDVTPIELAICWDMTPENPKDEPKRTKHIDGSNGSAAPAVFTMVHSPKAPENTSRKLSASKPCDGVHGCGTIKSNSAGSCRTRCNNDYFLQSKNKNDNNSDQRSVSTNSLYVNPPITRKPSKDIYNSCDSQNKLLRKETHKSSPNLSNSSCFSCSCSAKTIDTKKNCRPCEACDKKCQINIEPPKPTYKMAFKAGKFHENKSFDETVSSGSGTKTSIKVPKQKNPYAKRNYDIDSLHPPFSIWKGTSCQSYPEHWRLASIYQQSYKPLESRKKPLLATVYH